MPLKKAIYWTIFWVALSLIFNLGIYLFYPDEALRTQKALEFFTGYIIEKSLSVDNLFVFLMIFTYFGVEPKDQRRVLNWGIIGVIILRGILILAGTAMVNQFHWILYVFGLFLVYAGYRMAIGKDETVQPEKNKALILFKKFFPISKDYHGHWFFTKEERRWVATPLFVVLLVIETTDVVFAVDSIPAIFGITLDPFIVFTSNLMAVLGLRSLYFVLEQVQAAFVYVKKGVGIVLGYIGTKMLLMDLFKIPVAVSLSIVIVILTISVLLSIAVKNRVQRAASESDGS